MKNTILTLALSAGFASAAATFLYDSSSVYSGEWETFTDVPTVTPNFMTMTNDPAATGSYAQGVASAAVGLSSSALSLNVLDGWGEFFAGATGAGDRLYTHDGFVSYDIATQASTAVEYVRFSYAVIGEGVAIGLQPTLAGATVIDSGTYTYNEATQGISEVHYVDFQLDTASAGFTTTLGDVVSPFAPGSFTSYDAFLVEGFAVAPEAIPEPTTLGLLGLTSLMFFTRRRRG